MQRWYGPQLILCATWPRRPAGYSYKIAFQFRTTKRFWCRFDVRKWNVIAAVTSWPARPSCVQNQLRIVLNWFKNYENREIRKLWHFEISYFLTSPYEYSNERVGESPHNLSYILYMTFWKFSFFSRYR